MVTVRELTTADVSRVARMLGKTTRATQAEITKQGQDLSMMTLVLALLETTDDMYAWAADLIGVEDVEFEAMPATTILDIIDQLGEMPEARDFFARASRMAGGAWKRLSTQFSIDTAGLTSKSTNSPTPDSEGSGGS